MNASFVATAIKAKAPIVAIPVEGHAPVCIRRAKLAAWAKGMTITAVRVASLPDVESFVPARRIYDGAHPEFNRYHFTPEGPVQRVVTPGERRVMVEGHPAKSSHVRSRCMIVPVDRRTAVKELGIWSQKERERIQKRILMGALDTSQRKALKRAQFEDENETMIPVMVASPDGKTKRPAMGFPVAIPELSDLSFAMVKFGTSANDDVHWSVTELVTGSRAGTGNTAEKALLDARTSASKASPASLEKIRQRVRDAAALVSVAA